MYHWHRLLCLATHAAVGFPPARARPAFSLCGVRASQTRPVSASTHQSGAGNIASVARSSTCRENQKQAG
eukprot:3692797-Rhodomonas_salina.1